MSLRLMSSRETVGVILPDVITPRLARVAFRASLGGKQRTRQACGSRFKWLAGKRHVCSGAALA